ncbi:MAG: hypothetical protein INF71_18125 [Roseomonas sp.]|nr:hypothetical protein [Roseomonas sp.]
MTGALGFAVGTAALPGVFVAGDTNTGFFQASAAPDTLSVSVGGVEVGRYGAGGFMRLAAGTAAAPAYSFSGDTDTGLFSGGANLLSFSIGGYRAAELFQSAFVVDNKAGDSEVSVFTRASDASASNLRITNFSSLNETSVPVTTFRSLVNTDGSGNIELYATPAGSRASDRRVLRGTFPGSGAIALVGPVTVDGKALQIQRGTEVSPTGVSFVDFTGIPAGVRRITIMFDNLSFVADNTLSIQLGDAGGIETTGYTGMVGIVTGASSGSIQASSASQFSCFFSNWLAAEAAFGVIELFNMNGNKWIIKSKLSRSGTLQIHEAIGAKSLSDVMDRVRVKSDGSNFDAGAINIFWES